MVLDVSGYSCRKFLELQEKTFARIKVIKEGHPLRTRVMLI